MNFKEALYTNYRSTHNAKLYGKLQLEQVRNGFALNDFYFADKLPAKNARILDIGCGDGNFVYYLNEKGYKEAFGIDLSNEQIETGKAAGIQNISVADLHDYLENKESYYDCIIARDVVEHLTRQEAFDALLKINNALKKEGSFIMQVPNGEGLFYTSIFYGDYTHEMAYTRQTANQLFLNTGFSEVLVYPVSPYPKGIKGNVRSFFWKLKVLQTRFWKGIETGNPNGIFTSNLIAVGRK